MMEKLTEDEIKAWGIHLDIMDHVHENCFFLEKVIGKAYTDHLDYCNSIAVDQLGERIILEDPKILDTLEQD